MSKCYWTSLILHDAFVNAMSIQVRMQALKCFSVLAFENPQVSMTLVNGKVKVSLVNMHICKVINYVCIISCNFFALVFSVG